MLAFRVLFASASLAAAPVDAWHQAAFHNAALRGSSAGKAPHVPGSKEWWFPCDWNEQMHTKREGSERCVCSDNYVYDEKKDECVVQKTKAHTLTVKDTHPGGFGKAGRYFGFDNSDAIRFFGTSDFDKKLARVKINGEVVVIKVFKDNKNCKMSCGRLNNKQKGNWGAGDLFAEVVDESSDDTQLGLRMWYPTSMLGPASGWSLIVRVNGPCEEVVDGGLAACVKPLDKKAKDKQMVKWLSKAVPSLRKRGKKLGINRQRIGVMGYSWAGTVSFVFAAGAFSSAAPKGSEVNGVLLVSCGSGISQFPGWLDKMAQKRRGKPRVFMVECTQRADGLYGANVKLHKKLQKRGFSSTLHAYKCDEKEKPKFHYPQGESRFLLDLHNWIRTNFTST